MHSLSDWPLWDRVVQQPMSLKLPELKDAARQLGLMVSGAWQPAGCAFTGCMCALRACVRACMHVSHSAPASRSAALRACMHACVWLTAPSSRLQVANAHAHFHMRVCLCPALLLSGVWH